MGIVAFSTGMPPPSVQYRGLSLDFSTLPKTGDKFTIDGNRNGIGNNGLIYSATGAALITGGAGGIGSAAARKAIEEVSGDQLRGLSEVLGTLGLKIESISTAVGSSGDEAARQVPSQQLPWPSPSLSFCEGLTTFGQLSSQGLAWASRSSTSGKALAPSVAQALSSATLSRSTSTTVAPALTMACALAKPMPDAAPVTAATWPLRGCVEFMVSCS